MKTVSLESFKSKFNDDTKTELIDELLGGVLGSCHCASPVSGTSHCRGEAGEGTH